MNVSFICIHIAAMLVFPLALFVTIPLHIIACVVRKPGTGTLESLANQAQAIDRTRPLAVQNGERIMTFAEGWEEMKANKVFYVQIFAGIFVAMLTLKFLTH